MGGVCETNRGEKMHNGLWKGTLKERNHLKDIGLEGMIIFKWTLKK